MDDGFAGAMRQALERVRALDPAGATALIQAALAGSPAPAGDAPDHAPQRAPERRPGRAAPRRPLIDRLRATDAETGAASEPAGVRPAPARPAAPRLRLRLGEVVQRLREGRGGLAPAQARAPAAVPVAPEGAQWLSRRFACAEGARDYRLYVPAEAPTGLVLMLHGCRQDPDDFAVGSGMNRAAGAQGLLVAYPGQPQQANVSACWNWFDPAHQGAGAGEPAILAALARAVAAEFGVPAARVYVAGLSAGGAMAAILAERFPDLFAAAGVHSGLPTGAANDVVSAFAAMRGETAAQGLGRGARGPARARRLIVMHGDADATVAAVNAERLYAEARAALSPEAAETRRVVAAEGRRSAAVRRVEGPGGRAELWRIAGAGHAWAGGDPAGSWTDPQGPDASAEMVRFFLEED